MHWEFWSEVEGVMIHHPEGAVFCDGCDVFVDKDLAYGYCGNDTFIPQLYCQEMRCLLHRSVEARML